MATIEQAVAAYIRLRNEKGAIEKRHKEELAPLREKLERLEAWLLSMLNRQGVESTRTDAGTAYKSVRTSAKVVDWEATLAFIQENELWHMLEHRVSKTAIEEYAEQTGAVPPGIDVVQELRVNVRR